MSTNTYWPYEPTPWDDMFRSYGAQYGVDPHFMRAIAKAESNFDPRAVSRVGARGLTQFMPATAADYGITDPEQLFDPRVAIELQAKHLSRLQRSYPDWTPDKIAAAYNFGEGNVRRGVPYPKETQEYVPRVLGNIASTGDAEDAFRRFVNERLAGKDFQSDPEDAAKKFVALLADKKGASPSTQKLGDYTQYPKGSPEYFQAVAEQGGLPAIRPTKYLKGKSFPDSTQPFYGHTTETLYPQEYKARLVQVVDNDTFDVEHMGTGKVERVRLSDIQGQESRTPAGAAQKQYMMSMMSPGDQLTINTPEPGKDVGQFGRKIGRVYWHDKQGNVIDLSQPVDLSRDEESKPGEGDPGWMQGLWKSLWLEVPEMASFPQEVKAWFNSKYGDGTYDPEKESEFYAWAEGKERSYRDTMERFMAHGYDTDGPSVDIPGIGAMRMGEAVRFLAGGVAYVGGASGMLGKLYKVVKNGSNAMMTMKEGVNAVQIAKTEKEALLIAKKRAKLVKEVAKGDEAAGRMIEILDMKKEFNDEAIKFGHELMDGEASMSGIQKLRTFKDLYIAHATNKYHPIRTLAKATGRVDELESALNQIKAAADVAHSPITNAPRKWVHDPKTGRRISVPSYDKSLVDIWQNIDSETMSHAGWYMAYERTVKELWPEWNAALKKVKGNAEKAQKAAKKTGERLVPVSKAQYEEALSQMKRFEEMHKEIMPELLERMKHTREWSVQAFLQPLVDAGALSNSSLKNILKKNQFYAPYARLAIDDIDKILDADALFEIHTIEQAMMISGKGVPSHAGKIKGAGIASHNKTPMGRLTQAISSDLDNLYIVDPFQSFYTRGEAIAKYANQQVVRNMLGEMLDETLKESVQFVGKRKFAKTKSEWLGKSVTRVTDPKEVERVLNSTMENAFVSTRLVDKLDKSGKVIGDKVEKVAYIVNDPALASSIAAMSPTAMSAFKSMMQSPLGRAMTAPTSLFRRGTILGLSFMVRNPVRDQFMAAALTKYGYIPVVDWWKGLFGVLSNHPVYRALHGAGGTQASYAGAERVAALDAGIQSIEHSQGLGKVMHQLKDGALEAGEAASYGDKVKMLAHGGLNSVRTSGTRMLAGDSRFRMVNAIQKFSELFEDATRTGAALRAVKRMEKGKKYTISRSVDEALGGASGIMRYLTLDWDHIKGTGKRYKEARTVSKFQQDMALRAKKKGHRVLDQDVIDEVRNITLDFQRRGITGEQLNALYPFLNAELQDYSRFMRAFAEAPITTMMRGFAFVSLPAIANWYANFDNQEYQNLPDIEKELFIHPFGYDPRYKKFGRIPRPVGSIAGFFSLLPHKYLDWLAANDPAAIRSLEETLWPGKALRAQRDMFQESIFEKSKEIDPKLLAMASVATMGMSPMAGAPDPSQRTPADIEGDWQAKNVTGKEWAYKNLTDYASTSTALRYVMPKSGELSGIVNSAMPHALGPLVNIAQNWDPFFKSPIEPYSLQMKDLLPEDRVTEHTSPLEVVLANVLSSTPAGDISPIQAGHLWRRYTGSLGAGLLNFADRAGRETGVLPERPTTTRDFTNAPGVGAFWGRAPWGSNSQPVRALYDEWDRQERVLNSLNHVMKQGEGGSERLGNIMRDHPDWESASYLRDMMKHMSSYHQERRDIKQNLSLTTEERTNELMRIDQEMTQFAYLVMQAYRSLKTATPEGGL